MAKILHFGPTTQLEAFASTNASGSNDSAIAVRELLQNALDAVNQRKQEDNEFASPATVRFIKRDVPIDDIPAIEEYKHAFNSACECLKRGQKLGGPNKNIADIINVQLKKSKLPVLFVLDNGVGLDNNRMHSMLSDAAGTKQEGSEGGSFGVGHFAAFSLSNMNYLLYGGICKGRRIAAGHAQLASHEERDESYSKNGYLVHGLRSGLFDQFEFLQGKEIPKLISEYLNEVEEKFGLGSVIAITGFEWGKPRDYSWAKDLINIAAANFFPSIANGRLRLEIDDDGVEMVLNEYNLNGVFEHVAEDPRSLKSGAKKLEFWKTFKDGSDFSMDFEGETLRLKLRNKPEKRGIALLRSGMWITDEYPALSASYHYSDSMPFSALLLVDATAAKAHDAIRSSEGPHHNELAPRKYAGGSPKKIKHLERLCKSVREFLISKVEKLDSEPYPVPGFISAVERGQSIGESLRGAYSGEGVSTNNQRDPNPNPNPDSDHDGKNKPLSDKDVRAVCRYIEGDKTLELKIKALKDCEDTELWLGIDDGTDDSCVGLQWTDLHLQAASIDGKELQLLKRKNQENPAGVSLKHYLRKDQTIQLRVRLAADTPDNIAVQCNLCQRVA